MSSSRRAIGIVTAVLLFAAGAVAPGTAAAAQKYRFRFGTKMYVQWRWPADPTSHRRQQQAYEVVSGRGCGTSEAHAAWRITYLTPGSRLRPATIRVRSRGTRVIVVTARFGGSPAADVQGYLLFGVRRVVLTVVRHGNVASLKYGTRRARVSRKKVSRC
jgi:hypothetical protein